MIKHAIQTVINGVDLDFETAKGAMNAVMDGTATQAQPGAQCYRYCRNWR